MKVGSPTRSAIRSRIGTSTSGRLTELIAHAALAVDRRGDPEPDRLGLRAGRLRLAELRLELVEQLVEVAAVRTLGRLVMDVLLGVDDPDRHLRPAEIRPDRRPHGVADRQEFGPGMRY